jgi:hypothetical protein
VSSDQRARYGCQGEANDPDEGEKRRQLGSNPLGPTQEDCRTVSFKRVFDIVNGLIETAGRAGEGHRHPL